MIRTLVAAALVLSAGSLQLPRAAFAADQALPVPEIEKIVRDYLMREPEVIYEAIQELQKRQQAAEAARQQTSIVERADEIFRHPEDPIAGDPSGDVTLVEFFDYHCGYCRRMVGDLRTLVDADAKLRFVFKELPVLGPDSVTAAKAALAASKLDHDKYYDFHLALMQSKDISRDTVLKIAVAKGYDARRHGGRDGSRLGPGAARRQPRARREPGHQRHAQLRRRQDPDPRRRRDRPTGPAGPGRAQGQQLRPFSACGPGSGRRRPAAAMS